jgi:hypothetical protein
MRFDSTTAFEVHQLSITESYRDVIQALAWRTAVTYVKTYARPHMIFMLSSATSLKCL